MKACVRRATMHDVKRIHGALMDASAKGLVLPRSLFELYNHIREFVVMEDEEGTFVGCSSLSIIWEDLAEIRSLFVLPEKRRLGYGKLLAQSCIEEAQRMGIGRVFALTYQEAFFGELGFSVVGKDVLPQKIWADCIHCAKFPDCDEIAMMRQLDGAGV